VCQRNLYDKLHIFFHWDLTKFRYVIYGCDPVLDLECAIDEIKIVDGSQEVKILLKILLIIRSAKVVSRFFSAEEIQEIFIGQAIERAATKIVEFRSDF